MSHMNNSVIKRLCCHDYWQSIFVSIFSYKSFIFFFKSFVCKKWNWWWICVNSQHQWSWSALAQVMALCLILAETSLSFWKWNIKTHFKVWFVQMLFISITKLYLKMIFSWWQLAFLLPAANKCHHLSPDDYTYIIHINKPSHFAVNFFMLNICLIWSHYKKQWWIEGLYSMRAEILISPRPG